VLLAGVNYMNTNAVTGTTVTNFIDGKVSYINQWDPSIYFEGQTTLYKGGNVYPWLQPVDPTGAFLASMLLLGEDVELGIWPSPYDYTDAIGHALTLTGVNWNDANNNGIFDLGDLYTITVIDPANPVGLFNYNVALNAGIMQITNFPGPAGLGNYDIKLAVAESVPEPSTYALLCLGLGVLGYARKRMNKKEQ
jgi:hypothetical protein